MSKKNKPDHRLNDLGKEIWHHIMQLQAYEIALHTLPKRQHSEYAGTDYIKMIADVKSEIWRDLQTLFRGGVFPEDINRE